MVLDQGLFFGERMNAKTTRLLLIVSILAMSFACAWVVWSKFSETQPETQLLKLQDEISQDKKDKVEDVVQIIPEAILEINVRNKKIKSITSQDMAVKIWERGMRFRLKGSLCFEKDTSFRMKMNSLFGEELDIGSNDELFWYWSRRDRDPGVYFAYYEDLTSTRLKTPFNPIFLRTSLGILNIDTKNAQILDKDGFLAVIRESINGMGQKVLQTIFVDEKTKLIKGFMITDLNGQPLASCEIQKWENDLPKKILYTWHEEQKAMLIEFQSIKANESIPDSKWEMPNRNPRYNMADE